MAWRLTSSLDEFLAAAAALLHSRPVDNTVFLTVLEALRQSGIAVYGDDEPVFGWHEPAAGRVDGAFLQTPPFPVLIAKLPEGAAASLIELLTSGGRRLTGVNLAGSDEAGFAAAWSAATGGRASARQRSRLFRLVSRAALEAGAAEVVLFTDQANPVSIALYQRLGYRPVDDRVLLELDRAGAGQQAPSAGSPGQAAARTGAQ